VYNRFTCLERNKLVETSLALYHLYDWASNSPGHQDGGVQTLMNKHIRSLTENNKLLNAIRIEHATLSKVVLLLHPNKDFKFRWCNHCLAWYHSPANTQPYMLYHCPPCCITVLHAVSLFSMLYHYPLCCITVLHVVFLSFMLYHCPLCFITVLHVVWQICNSAWWITARTLWIIISHASAFLLYAEFDLHGNPGFYKRIS